jgi:hypothetical protein
MSGRCICALAAAVVVAAGGAGCGGGSSSVAWKGHPNSGPVEGGQMLFGTLVNRSAKPLTLRAAQVRVVDRSGHALPSAAAFAGGYNAAIALRGFGGEMFASGSVGATTGARAILAPGASAPLSVSWKGPAKAVVVAGTSLSLH